MQKFINNWSTTITQPLSVTDTVIHIDLASANRLAEGFQQGDYYLLTLDDGGKVEIVKVIAVNNAISIIRAQEGTNARDWSFESRIEMRVTANTLVQFETVIDKILTVNGEILVLHDGNVLYQ